MSEALIVAEATSIENTVAGRNPWSRSDLIGISLSVLCAIHCAATPVLIAMLPTLGLSWFEQPWVHQALFFGCFALAANAVLRGYRVHRKSVVPSLAAFGLALLAASAFIWPAPCCAGDSANAAVAGDAGASCSAGCCHHEVAESGAAGSEEQILVSNVLPANDSLFSVTSGSSSFQDLWLRLMTPLGGLLLIIAHGLNLRLLHSCRCGCCPA